MRARLTNHSPALPLLPALDLKRMGSRRGLHLRLDMFFRTFNKSNHVRLIQVRFLRPSCLRCPPEIPPAHLLHAHQTRRPGLLCPLGGIVDQGAWPPITRAHPSESKTRPWPPRRPMSTGTAGLFASVSKFSANPRKPPAPLPSPPTSTSSRWNETSHRPPRSRRSTPWLFS